MVTARRPAPVKGQSGGTSTWTRGRTAIIENKAETQIFGRMGRPIPLYWGALSRRSRLIAGNGHRSLPALSSDVAWRRVHGGGPTARVPACRSAPARCQRVPQGATGWRLESKPRRAKPIGAMPVRVSRLTDGTKVQRPGCRWRVVLSPHLGLQALRWRRIASAEENSGALLWAAMNAPTQVSGERKP